MDTKLAVYIFLLHTLFAICCIDNIDEKHSLY